MQVNAWVPGWLLDVLRWAFQSCSSEGICLQKSKHFCLLNCIIELCSLWVIVQWGLKGTYLNGSGFSLCLHGAWNPKTIDDFPLGFNRESMSSQNHGRHTDLEFLYSRGVGLVNHNRIYHYSFAREKTRSCEYLFKMICVLFNLHYVGTTQTYAQWINGFLGLKIWRRQEIKKESRKRYMLFRGSQKITVMHILIYGRNCNFERWECIWLKSILRCND